MNIFEKIKIFVKNFLKSFKQNDTSSTNDYSVNYARPEKRFFAFLVDSVIIYTLISCFIFIVIKKDVIKELDIKTETESTRKAKHLFSGLA